MTRYLMRLRTYDNVATIAPEEAADGAWVYADEAEAEIESLRGSLDEWKADFKAIEAELAEAVEIIDRLLNGDPTIARFNAEALLDRHKEDA